MKTLAVIFTYKRRDLLRPIVAQLLADGATVVVMDDDPKAAALAGVEHYIAKQNHGKKKFWQWMNAAFGVIRSHRGFDRYVILPDDVRLCRRFLPRCERRWATLPDKAVAMNVLVDSRAAKANWTNRLPVRHNVLTEESFWIDGCFYCERDFFQALGWKVKPIPLSRWSPAAGGSSLLGSGVWSQVTLRLHKAGFRMFRSWRSLAITRGAPSMMNPKARQQTPSVTLRWIDGNRKVAG